jgi:hypothetical protein
MEPKGTPVTLYEIDVILNDESYLSDSPLLKLYLTFLREKTREFRKLIDEGRKHVKMFIDINNFIEAENEYPKTAYPAAEKWLKDTEEKS